MIKRFLFLILKSIFILISGSFFSYFFAFLWQKGSYPETIIIDELSFGKWWSILIAPFRFVHYEFFVFFPTFFFKLVKETTIAIENDNPKECKGSNCLFEFAFKKSNEKICQSLTSEYWIEDCFLQINPYKYK